MHGTYTEAIDLLNKLKKEMSEYFGTCTNDADIFVIDKCIAVIQDALNDEEKAWSDYMDKEEKKEMARAEMSYCSDCGHHILHCNCEREDYKKAKMHWN